MWIRYWASWGVARSGGFVPVLSETLGSEMKEMAPVFSTGTRCLRIQLGDTLYSLLPWFPVQILTDPIQRKHSTDWIVQLLNDQLHLPHGGNSQFWFCFPWQLTLF
ncbi:MAG TPA: hypothetical protein DCP28_14930 [Cytophagales bacterium]|nr:hypothetical protein [Cytophagales bacterium]